LGPGRNLALSELHCTLLGMLLNTETGALAAGHIGDGLVAANYAGSGVRTLVDAPTPADPGEVYLLTQRDWRTHFRVKSFPPQEGEGPSAYYLMTDGVADDCQPPPPDVFQRWACDIETELRKNGPRSEAATRLLRWLTTYEAQGSWDDRTLVVLLRA
jgi:hypothetical protein